MMYETYNGANVVIGAGISGAVSANLIAKHLNEKVIVLEKRNYIGGNCFDYKDDKTGMTVHKFGSHIFHTNNDTVWNFLNNFASFNTYMHKVIALIDGKLTTIPFNLNTLYDVFPKTLAVKLEEKLLKKFEYNTKVPILEFQKQKDKDLKFLAKYIYEKIFKEYTQKQWGYKPEDIDSFVTARVPVYISKDNRYFQDKYQGIPLDGYTNLIKNLLNHKNIEVRFENTVDDISVFKNAKRIISSASIDEIFGYKFGVLPYRSVNFKFETHNMEYYQNNAVVNYPCNYDFTRIHEYKYYLNEKSDKTIIAKEYSTQFVPGENERFYPVCNDETAKLYQKYVDYSKECGFDNLYLVGRLGDFRYYDMDKAILKAMELFGKLNNEQGKSISNSTCIQC